MGNNLELINEKNGEHKCKLGLITKNHCAFAKKH